MSRTRSATHVLAIALLAALLAVPLVSAATRPPVQSVHVKQAIRALMLRGQALDRIYRLAPYGDTSKQAFEVIRHHPCPLTTCRNRYLVRVA